MLDQINDQIRALRSENREVDEAVDDQIKKRRAMDQSRIAWVIIWAFVVAIGSIFLLVFGGLLFAPECREGQLGCDPERWKEPAIFLLGIVSSVLLPVVTLVLGYYFGKEKSE
jgi:cytochrome bd-type quinol oxidase subunit 1